MMLLSNFLPFYGVLSLIFISSSIAAPYVRSSVSTDASWQQYVRSPNTRLLHPVRIVQNLTVGNVTNPENLVNGGEGSTILSRPTAADVPPTVVLDFGMDVVGVPEISFGSNSSPNHPGIKVAFSETLMYLTNRSDFTRSDNGDTITNGTDQFAVPPSAVDWVDQYGCEDGTKVCADGLHGFRYMKIYLDAIPADAPDTTPYGTVVIDSVSLNYTAFLGTPDTFTGWFECSDTQLTQFWFDGVYTNDQCIDTSRANDTDPRDAASPTLLGKLVLLDGAKRDRDAYSGDLAVSARTAYLSHDVSIAPRNVLADLADHQRPSGYIPPASLFNYTLALFDYPLWWVVSSYDLYLFTNDEEYMNQYYPNLPLVLDKYYPNNTDPTTGLVTLELAGYGDYCFSGRTGVITYINALYIQALRNAASIATFLGGHEDDAQRWSTRADTLSAKLNQYLWDPSVGAYLDTYSPNISHAQDGNSLAILSGAANLTYATSALDYLGNATARQYGNAFYDNDLVGSGYSERVYAFISYFELRARFETIGPDSALEEIRRLYGWMSTHDPLTTFWEAIGSGGLPFEGGFTSLSHGWSTGIVSLLTNKILGVEPASPGYQTWTIKPLPGDVSWAKGEVPTPLGSIAVDWSFNGSSFSLDVDSPGASKGQVSVPASSNCRRVLLDGYPVWTRSQYGNSTGQYEDGYVTVQVSGGQHTVTVY